MGASGYILHLECQCKYIVEAEGQMYIRAVVPGGAIMNNGIRRRRWTQTDGPNLIGSMHGGINIINWGQSWVSKCECIDSYMALFPPFNPVKRIWFG